MIQNGGGEDQAGFSVFLRPQGILGLWFEPLRSSVVSTSLLYQPPDSLSDVVVQGEERQLYLEQSTTEPSWEDLSISFFMETPSQQLTQCSPGSLPLCSSTLHTDSIC